MITTETSAPAIGGWTAWCLGMRNLPLSSQGSKHKPASEKPSTQDDKHAG